MQTARRHRTRFAGKFIGRTHARTGVWRAALSFGRLSPATAKPSRFFPQPLEYSALALPRHVFLLSTSSLLLPYSQFPILVPRASRSSSVPDHGIDLVRVASFCAYRFPAQIHRPFSHPHPCRLQSWSRRAFTTPALALARRCVAVEELIHWQYTRHIEPTGQPLHRPPRLPCLFLLLKQTRTRSRRVCTTPRQL